MIDEQFGERLKADVHEDSANHSKSAELPRAHTPKSRDEQISPEEDAGRQEHLAAQHPCVENQFESRVSTSVHGRANFERPNETTEKSDGDKLYAQFGKRSKSGVHKDSTSQAKTRRCCGSTHPNVGTSLTENVDRVNESYNDTYFDTGESIHK
mmetsp:Transcript_31465/g.90912  ORF Transcript_31465/g.90912 Transcript_31465/m.90912 type:complete len:154 (+) Transcript_31465:461-922(+)